jgi:PIN domain nuclease of toxin-antitoxin system
VTLLDAYALIAFAADEPAAAEVEPLLRGGDAAIVVTNLAEAVDVVERVHQVPAEVVEATVRPLIGAAVALRGLTEDDAWKAARLRARYYGPGSSELSLADCLLLAAARDGDRVATADPPLARAAEAEGIEVLGLPDRSGRRP